MKLSNIINLLENEMYYHGDIDVKKEYIDKFLYSNKIITDEESFNLYYTNVPYFEVSQFIEIQIWKRNSQFFEYDDYPVILKGIIREVENTELVVSPEELIYLP